MLETEVERFERYSSKGQNDDDNESDGTHDNRSHHAPDSHQSHFGRQRVNAAPRSTRDARRYGTAGNVALRATQTSPHASIATQRVFELLGSLATDLPKTAPPGSSRWAAGLPESLADP